MYINVCLYVCVCMCLNHSMRLQRKLLHFQNTLHSKRIHSINENDEKSKSDNGNYAIT